MFTPRHHANFNCSQECSNARNRRAGSNWRLLNKRTEYTREYEKANLQRIRSHRMRRRYGLTWEQAQALLQAQGDGCAVCGREIVLADGVKGRNLACVDHCHTTGKVRGLLCTPCNLMLGYAADNPEALLAAAVYLERSK
jgi:hypothetical protein